MFKKAFFILFIVPVFIEAQGIVTGDTVSTGIVYKNIKDTILTVTPKGTNTADFDLDGDNVKDVRFSISQNYSPGFTWEVQQVFSLNNIEIVVLNTPAGYVDSMAINSNINNSLNWSNATSGFNLFDYFYSAGNTTITGVFFKSNNYLAFRKKLATDTIYGWIFLDNGLYSGTKIRSWAYTSKLLGVQNLIMENNDVKVFPSPAVNELIVYSKTYKIEQLKIINSLGEIVLNQKSNVKSEKLSVNVNEFRGGIYFIELSTENGLIRKKFIKQ